MGKVLVAAERCKGCGYCVSACSRKVLFIDASRRNSSGYPVVVFKNSDQCTGCALCAEVCPDAVLEVFRRQTGVL